MKLQELLNKLIAIEREHGNLTVQGYCDGFFVSDLDLCVDGDFLRLHCLPNTEEEKEIYG